MVLSEIQHTLQSHLTHDHVAGLYGEHVLLYTSLDVIIIIFTLHY